MAEMNMMNIVIQIVLAIIIIVVLYIMTLVILNIDALVNTQTGDVKPHTMSIILSGYAPVSYLHSQIFNTYNPFTTNYVQIAKSMNTMGGSQFTYQFWIQVQDPTDNLYENLVILLKGDNRQYKIGIYDTVNYGLNNTIPADYVIACPLIRFVDSYRHLQVNFGTTNHPVTSIDINMTPLDPTEGRRNVLSLLPLNWYMFTFVFEDNFSYANASENGIKFSFWVNDFAYQENTASDNVILQNNVLSQNDGNLYLFPNADANNPSNFLQIGNIKYFNYALQANDIRSAFLVGPPTKSAMEINQPANVPTYLSAYNKIDIYNY